MRSTGNPTQWQSVGPSEESLRADISEGSSYVLCDGNEIVASYFFKVGIDETYRKIYSGTWMSDEPYAVIHRVAVKYPGRGLVGACFEECKRQYPHLRIDTHRDNIPMQKALAKAGFEYRGIIHLEGGEERLAYEAV
jgi:hypothetical protein